MKQICPGTGFDGLINAIDNCRQADKPDAFKKITRTKMTGLLQNAGLGNEGINVAELTENIFHTNGRDFILNRLREIDK